MYVFLLDQNLCYPSKLSDNGVMSRIMVREVRFILINSFISRFYIIYTNYMYSFVVPST